MHGEPGVSLGILALLAIRMPTPSLSPIYNMIDKATQNLLWRRKRKQFITWEPRVSSFMGNPSVWQTLSICSYFFWLWACLLSPKAKVPVKHALPLWAAFAHPEWHANRSGIKLDSGTLYWWNSNSTSIQGLRETAMKAISPEITSKTLKIRS